MWNGWCKIQIERTVNKGSELEGQCMMYIRNCKEAGVAAAQTEREGEVHWIEVGETGRD